MNENDALSLATVDELVDELARRFDHLLIAWSRPTKNHGDVEHQEVEFRGGACAAWGLVRNAKRFVKRHLDGEGEG